MVNSALQLFLCHAHKCHCTLIYSSSVGRHAPATANVLFTFVAPLRVVAPLTANVEPNVVAPLTPSVEPNVVAPVTLKVVPTCVLFRFCYFIDQIRRHHIQLVFLVLWLFYCAVLQQWIHIQRLCNDQHLSKIAQFLVQNLPTNADYVLRLA